MIVSDFQKRKIAHIFNLFDHDHDGFIQRSDFIVHGEKYAHYIGVPTEKFVAKQLWSWGLVQMHAELDEQGRMSRAQHQLAFSRLIAEKAGMLTEYLWDYLHIIWSSINKKNHEGLNVDEFIGVMFSDDVEQGKEVFQLLDFESTGYLSQQALFGHWLNFFWGTDPNSPSQWIFGKFK